jgi:hypothetical protein
VSAAFGCTFAEFGNTSEAEKLGALIAAATLFATHRTKQTSAWQAEIRFLNGFVAECSHLLPSSAGWFLALEFEIPRRGKRPDVVVLADDLIFVIEFKVGAAAHCASDIWQVLSYALDLRDFHLASCGRQIIPILVATGVAATKSTVANGVSLPVHLAGGTSGDELAESVVALHHKLHRPGSKPIDPPPI